MRTHSRPDRPMAMYRTAPLHIIGLLLSAVLVAPASGQRVIYVAQNATGANDGTSWGDAYRDLQPALDDVRAGGDADAEIWIAAGTYKPDRGTGDQGSAFELFGTIALYGGFAGGEERREERDPDANLTILSGDLNGDDDLSAPTLSDCCRPDLPATCSDAQCRAAVLAVSSSCGVRWTQRCNGLAVQLCCDLCRQTRCDNSQNVLRATEPGSAPTLDGLTILAGEAYGVQGIDPLDPGGGLYAYQSSPRVMGCTFRLNRGSTAALYSVSGTPVLERTAFVDNGIDFPSSRAAVISSPSNSPTLKQLTVARNPGIALSIRNTATVEDSSFVDNGIGLDCFLSDSCTVVRSLFAGNGWGISGGGLTRVSDSLFLRNWDHGLTTSGGTIVINSVFAGNTGHFAAAFDSFFGSAFVFNSVFFGNSAGHVGGMAIADEGATIRNSIFWGNSDAGGFTQQAQFTSNSTTVINVSNSIVQGWTGDLGGVGNSGVDPMFVDADGVDDIPGTEDDDLRLAPGSPGINAGSLNTSFLPATDLDGHPRVLCGRVDIGAYEFGIGDFNCDQTVDLDDFAEWAGCMTGPAGPLYAIGCEAFDSDADEDIDLRDAASVLILPIQE